MMYKEIHRQRRSDSNGDEDVVFVYYNGQLIYKRWVSRGYGVVFDKYKTASVFFPGNVDYALRKKREPFVNIMQQEYNKIK